MSEPKPINDGGPAFPTGPLGSISTPDGIISHQHDGYIGMSQRAYIATKVLAAIVSSGQHPQPTDPDGIAWHMKYQSLVAVQYADALIAELEEKP